MPAQRTNTTKAAGRILPTVLTMLVASALVGQERDPRLRWRAPPGHEIELDAAGFCDPIALAVVPTPGSRADDPKYFVAERGGVVKVVTNGGSVLVFAKAPFVERGPETQAELHGIALAPERGCVFVSFRTGVAGGPMRSGLARIDCEPGRLSVTPQRTRTFGRLFSCKLGFARNVIGPLAVRSDELFVGVENRGDPRDSRDLDAVGGKILRMDFDGDPIPANPFHTADGEGTVRDYVWASGLWRPCGLAFAGEKLFAADRGLGFDRLVQVDRGSDHRYDGTTWSTGIGPGVVFDPPMSALAFVPSARDQTSCGGTLLAIAGDGQSTATTVAGTRCAVFGVALEAGDLEVDGTPWAFLSPVGSEPDSLRGIAAGPDAVFVATATEEGDNGAVLRVSYGDGIVGGFSPDGPRTVMASYACFVCHEKESSNRPDAGLTLEPEQLAARLMKRLHSEEYTAKLDEIDQLEAYRFARKDVRQSTGMGRVRTWLRYKLVEPRFDDPGAALHHPPLTNEQAAGVVDELLKGLPETDDLGLFDRVRLVVADLVPHPRQRHLLVFLLIGCLIGGGGTCVLLSIRKRLHADRQGVDLVVSRPPHDRGPGF
jgi:glucose/arabinose dehydrogenase